MLSDDREERFRRNDPFEGRVPFLLPGDLLREAERGAVTGARAAIVGGRRAWVWVAGAGAKAYAWISRLWGGHGEEVEEELEEGLSQAEKFQRAKVLSELFGKKLKEQGLDNLQRAQRVLDEIRNGRFKPIEGLTKEYLKYYEKIADVDIAAGRNVDLQSVRREIVRELLKGPIQ